MTLSAGDRLGPYEIRTPLGAGGMGEVYRARDTRLGRDVAIKVLLAHVANDPVRLRRFEHEALSVAALSHPNILALHDVGSHEGAPYLVSELLEGRTLREEIVAGGLPLRRAVDVAVQIARGLAAAHEKGIVHRDLKPGNVFVTKDGHVKILDFGIAKLTRPDPTTGETTAVTAAPSTETGAIVGTVGYMAPEQVRGLPCDHRADIFAFGCVLYELLSGRAPFHRGTTVDTLTALLHADPPDLSAAVPGVPPALERVVRRCLEKEPAQRFSSAHDLALAVEALGAPTTASRAASGGPAPVEPVRRRLVAAAVALAFVAVGVAAAAWFTYRAGQKAVATPQPSFTRLTFRRGWVGAARFTHDGHTVVYSAAWDGGPNEVFTTRVGSVQPQRLDFPTSAELLAVSPTELALGLEGRSAKSTLWGTGWLARAPLSGGEPRKQLDRVPFADWSPDGRELAIVRETDTVDRLEFPEGRVLAASAVLSYPRVSPSGDKVAFVESADDFYSGAIAVVETKNRRKATLTEVLPNPMGLAWSPSGDEIWFTAGTPGGSSLTTGRELRAVTLDKRQRVVLRVPNSMRLLDLARDGRALVAFDRTEGRAFFRGEKDTSDRELSYLDQTGIESVSSDGRRVVFTENGDGTGASGVLIYLRETSGRPPQLLGPGYAGFSSDERFVVGMNTNTPKEIVVYPVDAGSPRTARVEGVRLMNAWALLPDGRSVVMDGNEQGRGPRIWLADLGGSRPRPISPEGVMSVRPKPVPPDGTFVLGTSGGLGLGSGNTMVYPIAGGEPRPFKGLGGGELVGGWSPDGQACFAYRGYTIPMRIYRVDGRTGSRTLVQEITPADRAGRMTAFWAVVTPSARAYAYSTFLSQSQLFLVEGLK
jgi:eukaryotic-like serine/threonine-protein kinase